MNLPGGFTKEEAYRNRIGRKWTLSSLQRPKETQSSTDSGSSGCCNWWNTTNMLTCRAISALPHLAIIDLSWEQLHTLCETEEKKTEHTCRNSVKLCRYSASVKERISREEKHRTVPPCGILLIVRKWEESSKMIRDGVRALNLCLWPEYK